jgi:hypothetical protein
LKLKASRRRPARRIAGLVVGTVLAMLIAVPTASAATTPFVDIHSSGPLTDIYIGNDLGCQVRNGGFTTTEYFPNANGPGDCGTFLSNAGELYGPDFAHHGSTATNFTADNAYASFTPVSQTGVAGSGTAGSPYEVTTTVAAASSGLTITEVDSYVVGNDYFQTDLTVTNNSGATVTALVYHAADCLLRGSTAGFGAIDTSTPNAPAPSCTETADNSQASASEEFMPITSSNSYVEEHSGNAAGAREIWGDIAAQASLSNSCDCTTNEDNAEAIDWTFLRRPTGTSSTFSMRTVISDTAVAGGFSFSGPAESPVGGTVATITDPNTTATASAYSATINWGDGVSTPGTVTGGNGSFTVTGNHAYTAGGQFPVAVTITSVGTNLGTSTVADSATITAPPTSVLTTEPPTITATGVAFSGSANPNGLPTTAVFQYGLDLKYSQPGKSGANYTNSTPSQTLGSDFATHAVSASVTGLVPNALYHVRLVATNSAGTTFGPDVTFTTGKLPAPGSPTLGKTFNISLVSGLVLVKVNGQFIPLTELTQIPKNTVINALHGTLSLTSAAGGPSPARDAAAKGKKHKPKTQKGTFGGAIFKISQTTAGAGKGLVTLAIVENAFKGAPSYATCKAHLAPEATAASSRTLQLLHASAKGKFRTKGKYSAATVLGTKWTVADRCDGTLTHDITDSVLVNDFVHHRSIVLHAGQSYLAKAPKHK